jgi:hypothetical protein
MPLEDHMINNEKQERLILNQRKTETLPREELRKRESKDSSK